MKSGFTYSILMGLLIIVAAMLLISPSYAAPRYFYPQIWVTGRVDDLGETLKAQDKPVDLYLPSDPAAYATDTVGTNGRTGQNNTYMINVFSITTEAISYDGVTVEVAVSRVAGNQKAGPVAIPNLDYSKGIWTPPLMVMGIQGEGALGGAIREFAIDLMSKTEGTVDLQWRIPQGLIYGYKLLWSSKGAINERILQVSSEIVNEVEFIPTQEEMPEGFEGVTVEDLDFVTDKYYWFALKIFVDPDKQNYRLSNCVWTELGIAATDEEAPLITSVSPLSFTNDPTPLIKATYQDQLGGSGINVGMIQLKVDEIDRTDPQTGLALAAVTPQEARYQVSTPYQEGEQGSAYVKVYDNLGNEAERNWVYILDSVPPQVVRVLANGYDLATGDVIGQRPTLEAIVSDNVSLGAVRLYVHWGQTGSYQNKTADSTTTEVTATPPTWRITYDKIFSETDPEFAVGAAPQVRVEVTDTAGTTVTREVTQLEVASGTQALKVMNVPNPFNPNVESTRITYQLTMNADIDLYIYDITGVMIWKRNYAAGEEGGHVGYNEILWNGVSDFGEQIGSGVYLFRVVYQGRTIGQGKIAVLK